MPQYVHLCGKGPSNWNGTTNAVFFQSANNNGYLYINTPDVRISGITFYGAWDTGMARAIRIEDTGTNINNVQIEYCTFRGYINCIHFLNAFGSSGVNTIRNCTFITPQSATGYGIYSEDISHWTIQDCHFLVNNYANSAGIYFYRSATEGFPHTERIVLMNCGFNGGALCDAAIVVDVHRVGDNRGELDNLTIIGGNIENFATGIHVASDGVRSLITLVGTTFFSTSVQEILTDAGTDLTYISAIECYGLNAITNNGSTKITVSGEWPKYLIPTLPYLPATTWQTNAPNGHTPATGATLYIPLEGELTTIATENRCELRVPRDGVVRGLRVWALASANTATVTMRLNNADTALTCNITGGGGEAEYVDAANTFTVTQYDDICFKIVTHASNSPTLYTMSVEFIPS